MSNKYKKVVFKKAIGAKTEVGEVKQEKKVLRNGHVTFLVPEARAYNEMVSKENKLREEYFQNKVYLRIARNPLNGEHTPRKDDEPNVSEAVREDKYEYFSPEIPMAQPSNKVVSTTNRQVERNGQMRTLRDSIDKQLDMLQNMYGERSVDVEQSLLRNRLKYNK